jgi:hypothetical protein
MATQNDFNPVDEYVADDVDPNLAWYIVVAIARQMKESVQVFVEFDEGSEFKAAKMRLAYDPVTGTESHDFLDS